MALKCCNDLLSGNERLCYISVFQIYNDKTVDLLRTPFLNDNKPLSSVY